MADNWEGAPDQAPFDAVLAATDGAQSIRRGFDDTFPGCLPHEAVDPRTPVEQPFEVFEVRGTLAAIAELASWWIRFEPCHPQDADTRAGLAKVAQEIEALARALWCAVTTYRDETEDVET